MTLLTTGRAAKQYGVSKKTMYRWLEDGRVPDAYKIDGVGWLVPIESLDKIERPIIGRYSQKKYRNKETA